MQKLAFLGDRHVTTRGPSAFRCQHILDVWDAAIDDAAAQGVTAFVGLGDVAEGWITEDEAAALSRRYAKMRAIAPTFEVLGNHESGKALRWATDVSAGVTVADDSVIVSGLPTLDEAEVLLLLIPYPRRGSPPFEDLEHDGTIAGSLRAAAEAIAGHVSLARDYAKERSLPLIVGGHFTIEGMRVKDTEFEMHSATEVVVPRMAFDGVDLGIVAHIHTPQDLCRVCGVWQNRLLLHMDEAHRDECTPAFPRLMGSGSLLRHSHAEAEDEKSYTLVSVEGGHVTVERRPVIARGMWSLKVKLLDGGAITLPEGIEDQVRDREAKVVLDVAETMMPAYDPTVWDPIRQAAAHFILDGPHLIPTQRVRAPELQAAIVARQQEPVAGGEGAATDAAAGEEKALTLHDLVAVWLRVTNQAVEGGRADRLTAKVEEVIQGTAAEAVDA